MTKFAWSDAGVAMQFAFQLANKRISSDFSPQSNHSKSTQDGFSEPPVPALDECDLTEQRIRSLLDMLQNFAPVKFATLWKHKLRGEAISAIARSSGYSPNPETDETEFVCRLGGTHADLILEEFDTIPECRLSWLRQWSCDDVNLLRDDLEWNTPDRIKALDLKRQYSLGLGGFCADQTLSSRTARVDRQGSIDYILNLYLDEKEVQRCEADEGKPFRFDDGVKKDFIKSVTTKIASGICAMIELRKNEITDAMISARIHPGEATMAYAMRRAAKRVVPEYIRCKRAYLVVTRTDGSLEQAMVQQSDAIEERSLTATELKVLEKIVERAFPVHLGANAPGNDTSLVVRKQIDEIAKHADRFQNASQLLIARLESHYTPHIPRGYLVLIDRINDLAFQNGKYLIDDFFDWEDELYLRHIASILDFIAGLYDAQERSIQQAMLLGHEIKTPIRFIYETAYRQKEMLEGNRDMPGRMAAREIDDILDTAEYIEAVGDSLSSLMQPADIPPANRYLPEEVNPSVVAREMARICLPLCRKTKLDPAKILIDLDPTELFMDEAALRQIFLNVLVNALKYSKDDKRAFKVHVQFDAMRVTDLRTTTNVSAANPVFDERIDELGIRSGTLVTIEDEGIGIAGGNSQRVFDVGFRETTNFRAGIFGAGIGLSVVRSILRDHFSDIWVESRSEPTQFCFFLSDLLEQERYTKSEHWLGRGKK